MFVTRVKMEVKKLALDGSVSVRSAWMAVARSVTYDDALEHVLREFADREYRIDWED